LPLSGEEWQRADRVMQSASPEGLDAGGRLAVPYNLERDRLNTITDAFVDRTY
jgi:hypothetical protein